MSLTTVKVVVLLAFLGLSHALSESDYETIIDALEEHWKEEGDLQPKALRLAFHDCPTICDGCVNMTSSHNNGLQEIIDDLEILYPTYGSPYGLSRADFWALAGISAVTRGVALSNRACGDDNGVLSCTTMPDPSITFRTGRVDCDDAPYYLTGDEREFPTPRMTADEMFEYYAHTDGPGFGFNEDEVTALMGAHTLGKMVKLNSGHVGPWLLNRTNQFNNQYYEAMFSTDLTWANFNPSGRRDEARYQFRATNEDDIIYANFINTDFALLYNMTLDEDWLTDCDVSAATTNCTQSSTYNTALEYKNDATKWMEDFSAVFEKMIENGYDSLTSLTSD